MRREAKGYKKALAETKPFIDAFIARVDAIMKTRPYGKEVRVCSSPWPSGGEFDGTTTQCPECKGNGGYQCTNCHGYGSRLTYLDWIWYDEVADALNEMDMEFRICEDNNRDVYVWRIDDRDLWC